MGMRAITDERGVKVWVDTKSQYPRYLFSISKKKERGDGYDNFYMEIKFKKNLPQPDNGDEIIIKDSFMSFNIGKDGKKYPYLMILEYENLDSKKSKDFMDIPDSLDESVPFK